MNEREIAEIKRRYKIDKNNITKIHGCYVNERKEIISSFEQSMVTMTETEKEMYLTVLKRTLSGTVNKNLIDIEFETSQVVDGEEHKFLMELKNTKLQNKEQVEEFFNKIIENTAIEGNYLILLTCDVYDVPYKGKSGSVDMNMSTDSFTYILCSICPVKQTKSTLGYSYQESVFQNKEGIWAVSPPIVGFMFPSFDDRSTNIYNALYYTKDTVVGHDDFIDTVFKTDAPMSAAIQKESFESLITDTVGKECSLDTLEQMHEKIGNLVIAHKESREPNALTVSAEQIKYILEESGVSEEKLEGFEQNFEAEFGEDFLLSPKNVVDVKQYNITTPDVVIKVNPDRKDLVQTRVIDGKKYILIDANEGVELNGISFNIDEE